MATPAARPRDPTYKLARVWSDPASGRHVGQQGVQRDRFRATLLVAGVVGRHLAQRCRAKPLAGHPRPRHRAHVHTALRARAGEREKLEEDTSKLDLELLDENSGEYCTLPEWDDEMLQALRRPVVPQDPFLLARNLITSFVFFVLPFAGPAFVFWQWKTVLALVHLVIGEERQLLELTQVTLTPATNGIVVASLSIALGTLTSVTVSTLRQRQLQLRSCLNREACELAVLQAALTSSLGPLPEGKPRRPGDTTIYLQSLTLLRAYTARIFAESSSVVGKAELQGQSVADNELIGMLGVLRACGTPQPFTVYPVRDEATMRITRLNDARSERLAALCTDFPIVHWVILAALAGSIALCFLIEVDQSEGRFFLERPEDSLRLRLVFTVMTGAFCGLTTLCADLNDPFRGSFNIERSTRQFSTMMQVLDLEIAQIKVKAGC